MVVYIVQPINVLVKRDEGIKPDIKMADISVGIYKPFTFGVKISTSMKRMGQFKGEEIKRHNITTSCVSGCFTPLATDYFE